MRIKIRDDQQKQHNEYTVKTTTRCQRRAYRQVVMDSDSLSIAIDNHASACLSPSTHDFEGEITMINQQITGIASGLTAVGRGTLKWKWQDNEGHTTTFRIPNSLYVPKSPMRILSPQHWVQGLNDNFPQRRDTWCATYDDGCDLFWAQNSRQLTVGYNARSNVPIIHTAPNTKKYRAFAAVRDCLDTTPLCDEDQKLVVRCASVDVKTPQTQTEKLTTVSKNHSRCDKVGCHCGNEHTYHETFTVCPVVTKTHSTNKVSKAPQAIQFEASTNEVVPPQDLLAENETAELLRWHQRLNHMSFKKLKLMASIGMLPTRLASARVPRCACCIFGTMTKKRTRKKKKLGKHLKQANAPGAVVSVDQMECTAPGFIGQLKGRLTTSRYKFATIFVDHHSRLGFVYLQRTSDGVETLDAKNA